MYLSSDSNATPQNSTDNALFIDTTEAADQTNRLKGLKTPGWNIYIEYGNGRRSVETLVAMKVTAADASVVPLAEWVWSLVGQTVTIANSPPAPVLGAATISGQTVTIIG